MEQCKEKKYVCKFGSKKFPCGKHLEATSELINTEDNGGGHARSRAGGMSVCLSGPEGRVFGGGLAGLFVAAGPVQVMVGTFVAGHELSQERRQRFGAHQPSSISFNITAEERKARFEPAPTISYPHENTMNAVHNYYTNSFDHATIPGGGREAGEEDNDELQGEEEEFGGDSQSDNKIPS